MHCFVLTSLLVTAPKGYLILFHNGMRLEPKIKNPFLRVLKHIFIFGVFFLCWWFNPYKTAIVVALLSPWNYWRTECEVILCRSSSSDIMDFQPWPNIGPLSEHFWQWEKPLLQLFSPGAALQFLAERKLRAKRMIMCSYALCYLTTLIVYGGIQLLVV